MSAEPDQAGHAPHERTLAWKLLQIIARIVASWLFDLKAYGVRNVPPTGGVLLVSNHQSFLDPVLLGVHLRRPLCYMARSSLFRGGFFEWLIRSLNAFPVQQGKGDLGAIRQTIQRLEQGYLLNVYPEGSRTEDGNIGPIQPGIALILKRVDVPIVPVVIDGAFAAWPRGRRFFRPHPIRVMYGPPMDVKGLSSEQIVARVDQTLRTMLRELRQRETA